MKTLLQVAQNIGMIEEFEFTFTNKHILRALQVVSISTAYERAVIYAVFGYAHDAPLGISKENNVAIAYETALKKEDISAFPEVYDKLAELKAYGVDLKKNEIYSFFEGEYPIDYEPNFTGKLTLKKPIEPFTEKDFTALIKTTNIGFNKLNQIKRLKHILNAHILDQENAVEAICDLLVKSEHIKNEHAPKGTVLFLGPSATGKTALAKLLSEQLPDYEKNLVIDMTQFTHKDSGGGLYGTNRMWGNAAPGLLTSFVKNHPRSIIVFDEFDKAHQNIQNNLLSIFSSGSMEDACGWCEDGEPWHSDRKDDDDCRFINIQTHVDFTETIIIFTTNLGSNIYNNTKLLESLKENPEQIEEMLFTSLATQTNTKTNEVHPYISPALLSRLRQGKVVLFNKLNYHTLHSIAEQTFQDEKKAFEKNYKIKIVAQENVLDALLLNFLPALDVRAIKASIGKKVFDTITDHYMETGKIYKKVLISLDSASNDFLSNALYDAESFIKELKHKNRSLHFRIASSETKTILKLIIYDIEIITVKNPEHYSKGGINIEVPDITFDQIAGHTFVKNKLKEIVGLLKDSKNLKSFDIMPAKGMLLYGPPGTGKTMLAKALANEADLPFISTTGKDLTEEGRIDEIFAMAREHAPSIVFIDEIDSIPSRKNNLHASYIINTLLTNIDGFESYDEPVFIIAATNIKDRIDEALIRSGRIDIHVEISALDKEARLYFIDKMIEKEIFDKDIDKEKVLKFTASLNGSDLEKIERESILYVLKNHLEKVTQEIIIEQINTIKYGRRVEDKSLENVLKETAYHEAGHAVISKVLNPQQIIEQITVMPRHNALGFVSFSESDKYNNSTKIYFQNQICVALAGRIAQAKKFGEEHIDSGAHSDLKTANTIAYQAITRYGMDETLLNMNIDIFDAQNQRFSNEIIFERVQEWIRTLSEQTKDLVEKNWHYIDPLAQKLLEDEQIDGKVLDDIIKDQTLSTKSK